MGFGASTSVGRIHGAQCDCTSHILRAFLLLFSCIGPCSPHQRGCQPCEFAAKCWFIDSWLCYRYTLVLSHSAKQSTDDCICAQRKLSMLRYHVVDHEWWNSDHGQHECIHSTHQRECWR